MLSVTGAKPWVINIRKRNIFCPLNLNLDNPYPPTEAIIKTSKTVDPVINQVFKK